MITEGSPQATANALAWAETENSWHTGAVILQTGSPPIQIKMSRDRAVQLAKELLQASLDAGLE